jgi:low temperature requirement protein LtrA
MRIATVRPPRLRTISDEQDRTATWLELFYDLVFVVAVSVLGGRLLADTSWTGIWSYLGYFGLLWWLWASHTFYADRYDTDDLVYRLLATGQMAAVVLAAASLSTGPSASTMAFAVAYTAARLILIAMYYRAHAHVTDTRSLVRGYLIGFGIGAVLWAVSIFVPEPSRFALWTIGLTVELATPWVMRREQARVPLDVSHLPERFGLFTILVLGESIAAVVVGLSHVEWSSVTTITALIGVGVAGGVWWLYFDNVEGAVVRRRDPDRRTWRPTVWIYSHFPLVAGVAMVGVGLEHTVVEAGHGALGNPQRWLLVGAVALAFGAMAVIHVCIPDGTHYKLHNVIARNRIIGAAVVIPLGLLSGLSPIWIGTGLLLACVGEVVSDLVAWDRHSSALEG